LARQLHPRRRRAQRLRHLPAAPQGGRHRPPDDPVRHGVRAAHHGRHAAGKPAPREGAARGAGEELGVIERLAIVGVGLLGGSVAKAARAHGLAREIVGVGRDQARLRPAVTDGTLDRATTDLAEGLRGAERVILAATVLANETLLPAAWRAAAAGAIITDVGSTKRGIVAAATRLAPSRRDVQFVGSHPMAGSEKSGYAVSRADLFQNATVVVTPSELNDPAAVKSIGELWAGLGGRVVTLDPETHDRAVAAISHLPHVVAWALVDAVARFEPDAFAVAARG